MVAPAPGAAGRLPLAWVAALLAALTLAAFAARVLPALPVVFPEPGEVRLVGYDAYYHLRHAGSAARHFPRLARWDVATHYPTGQRAEAAGLFDLALAALALGLGGGEERLLRVAAWLPAVLGALVVPALFLYALPSLGRGWALAACAAFVVHPGLALPRSLLGFADHHVAEIWLGVLSAAGLAHCAGGSARGDAGRSAARGWVRAFAAALPMAAFLFTWSGAPIFLAVMGLAALALLVFRVARDGELAATAAGLSRYGAALLALAGGAGLAAPELVMVPEVFPAVLLACAGLAAAPPLGVRAERRARARGLTPRHFAAALLLVLAAAAAAALAHERLRTLAALALAPKSQLVAEHDSVTLARFWRLLGPVGVLAALGLPLGARAAWRRGDARPLVPLAVGVLVAALWWRTRDYGYLAAPLLAVPAAHGARELWRLLPEGRRPPRAWAALAAACLLTLPLWPERGVSRPWRSRQAVARARGLGDGWFQAARWLRAATPAPSLAVDARVGPWSGGDFAYPSGTYGVLCAWPFGSFVAAIGRRPVVWSRGPDGDPTARWLLLGDEARAVSRLCPRCRGPEAVRYVAVDARSAGSQFAGQVRQAEGDPDDYAGISGELRAGGVALPHWRRNQRYHATLLAALYLRDGRGLGHFRLVYESPHRSLLVTQARPAPGSGFEESGFDFRRRTFPLDAAADRERFRRALAGGVTREGGLSYFDAAAASSVKLFERVAGASLEGAAPGAERVELRLRLRARASGRELEYRRDAPVAADGGFALVVPHPSRGGSGSDVVALGPYRVALVAPGGGEAIPVARVHVGVADVRAGRAMDVGRLVAPAPRD